MIAIVKVDKKGRIVIPKKIRERVELRAESIVKVTAKERSVVIEPLERSSDRYFGAFKIDRWPEDLDEFTVEVMKRWWKEQAT
ncbi:MAG: AbrB/MazE/SpoVT family DNA-binding domain-containing protein [Candidatus Bathyarchaeia archaeon]